MSKKKIPDVEFQFFCDQKFKRQRYIDNSTDKKQTEKNRELEASESRRLQRKEMETERLNRQRVAAAASSASFAISSFPYF